MYFTGVMIVVHVHVAEYLIGLTEITVTVDSIIKVFIQLFGAYFFG